MNNSKSGQKLLPGVIAFLLLLVFDQLTKCAAYAWLRPVHSIELIPGVFQLYYLENRGAAFGILHDRQIFFIAAALLITVLTAWVYYRIPSEKRYCPLRCVCILLVAGAIGNMLDRMFRGIVVDFLYISLIDFPVFNVADCYVCIGVGVLLILLFTYYKDESFEFLRPGRRKEQ